MRVSTCKEFYLFPKYHHSLTSLSDIPSWWLSPSVVVFLKVLECWYLHLLPLLKYHWYLPRHFPSSVYSSFQFCSRYHHYFLSIWSCRVFCFLPKSNPSPLVSLFHLIFHPVPSPSDRCTLYRHQSHYLQTFPSRFPKHLECLFLLD